MIEEPWPKIIRDLCIREAGGREHPDDMGGPTRYGMTLATYRDILRRPEATEEELRGLSMDVVAELYYRHWVLHPRLSLYMMFPNRVAEVVLDTAVLFSRRRAAKWLQESIGGLEVDGWIGPVTRDALAIHADSRLVISRLVRRRVHRHATVIRDNPVQAKFGVGWATRALDWLEMP
jgi:lysozyme family protein